MLKWLHKVIPPARGGVRTSAGCHDPPPPHSGGSRIEGVKQWTLAVQLWSCSTLVAMVTLTP